VTAIGIMFIPGIVQAGPLVSRYITWRTLTHARIHTTVTS